MNPAGHLFFVVSPFGTFGEKPEVWTMVPRPGSQGEGTTYQVTTDWPANGFALDPSTEEVYESVETREDEVEPHGLRIDRYSADCNPASGPCEPTDTFGEGHLSKGKEACIPGGYGNPFACELNVKGIAVDGSTHTVYAVNSESGGGEVAVFGDVRPIVTTGEPTERGNVQCHAHREHRSGRQRRDHRLSLRIRVRQEIWPLGSLHARPGIQSAGLELHHSDGGDGEHLGAVARHP